MAWRLAAALIQLRAEINNKFPNRRKDGDGTIGDDDHQNRSSDHNPWVMDGGMGVVTALDLTHDPKSGMDSYWLAEKLLESRDPRIKYIISNRKIASGSAGPKPWEWRAYSGKNPHNHHIHISVKSDKAHYDNSDTWNKKEKDELGRDVYVDLLKPGTTTTRDHVEAPRTLREGAGGEMVKELQRLLKIEADGIFGPMTKKAVIKFQEEKDLHADGVVGPMTWSALGVTGGS